MGLSQFPRIAAGSGSGGGFPDKLTFLRPLIFQGGQASAGAIGLDSGSTEAITYGLTIPSEWNGKKLKFKIFWSESSGGQAGDTYLQIALSWGTADSEAWNANSEDSSNTMLDSGDNTANKMHMSPEYTTTATFSTNDFIQIKAQRKGGEVTDTMVGDCYVWGITIEQTS